jgi:hypothetical protein
MSSRLEIVAKSGSGRMSNDHSMRGLKTWDIATFI